MILIFQCRHVQRSAHPNRLHEWYAEAFTVRAGFITVKLQDVQLDPSQYRLYISSTCVDEQSDPLQRATYVAGNIRGCLNIDVPLARLRKIQAQRICPGVHDGVSVFEPGYPTDLDFRAHSRADPEKGGVV